MGRGEAPAAPSSVAGWRTRRRRTGRGGFDPRQRPLDPGDRDPRSVLPHRALHSMAAPFGKRPATARRRLTRARPPLKDGQRAGAPLRRSSPGKPMALEPRLLANAIRALSMDAVQAANSGHPGMPMGMADVATILFTEYLKHDPADPDWHDRDRFVLSAGHGSMLIYALAPSDRLRASDDRGDRQLPPARLALRRPSREFHARRASRRRPARSARASPWRSEWRSPSGISNAVFGDDLVDHRTWVHRRRRLT